MVDHQIDKITFANTGGLQTHLQTETAGVSAESASQAVLHQTSKRILPGPLKVKNPMAPAKQGKLATSKVFN